MNSINIPFLVDRPGHTDHVLCVLCHILCNMDEHNTTPRQVILAFK